MAYLKLNRNGEVSIKKRVMFYDDIAYNRKFSKLSSVIHRGNIICHLTYNYGGGHGAIPKNLTFGNKSRNHYDCSSSICTALHPKLWKPSSSGSTGDFYNYPAGYPSDYKKASIIVHTFGQGGASQAHVWMDIWWEGSRVTWDNCGSRKPGKSNSGHSCWWPGGTNPSRNVLPYSIRHINL